MKHYNYNYHISLPQQRDTDFENLILLSTSREQKKKAIIVDKGDIMLVL